LCGGSSTRAHSFYSRRLAGLPWQGRIVELQVRVPRFRCTSLECRRRIFAERLDITRPRARRTVRLHEIQQQISLALGGEPGSRPAGRAFALRTLAAQDIRGRHSHHSASRSAGVDGAGETFPTALRVFNPASGKSGAVQFAAAV
jgi:transposase